MFKPFSPDPSSYECMEKTNSKFQSLTSKRWMQTGAAAKHFNGARKILIEFGPKATPGVRFRPKALTGFLCVGGFTMLSIRVNKKTYSVDVEPETPLLWVIRDTIGLTGTKYSCGLGLCGACTVHLNGKAIRSCLTPVSQAVGQEITTIEGLFADAQHPAQIAWREGDVPECGYCQSGQIMAAAALLSRNSAPTDADIDREITNLCRCGTYARIRQGIHRAAQIAAGR
jgi:isoquinoline 1-oxidoreductase alpha subunit